VSGQVHSPAALSPGKQPPLPIWQEAGWAVESAWTLWKKKKKPELCVVQPIEVAIPTALSLEGQENNIKSWASVVRVQAEIQTSYLPKTSEKICLLSQRAECGSEARSRLPRLNHLSYSAWKSLMWCACMQRLTVESSVFPDITLCTLLKVNRRFGGTRLLHLQGGRIRQGINQRESRCQT
jgi:hypothetical protein